MFLTRIGPLYRDLTITGLHCLSAFTVFLTGRAATWKWSPTEGSPLPFGIHRVPDGHMAYRAMNTVMARSPLPFGIHRVPDVVVVISYVLVLLVSIAFRHSPCS